MDEVRLELARPARTGLQRWWWVAVPAVLGLVVASGMAMRTPRPPPVPDPIIQCASTARLMNQPDCQRRVLERMPAPTVTAAGVPVRSASDEIFVDYAMYEVREEIRRAERVHESATTQWQAEVDEVVATRWRALWPLSLGLLLSLGALLIARRRQTGHVHSIVLTAHHIRLGGQRLPIAEIESFSLSHESRGWRTLTVTPEVGTPIEVHLDALDPSTDELERLLAQLPDAETRAEERRRIASMELAMTKLERR